MSSPLQRLWKLHEVDAALVEVKQRAAALDPGRKLMAEIKALEGEEEAKSAEARRVSGEQADLELANKGIEDKLKRIDKDLYGGKVVNPREVENLEKEVASLKKQREKHDEQLLGLMDLVPPAQAAAKEVRARVEAKRAELKEYQKRVLKEQERLKEEFSRIATARASAASGIEAPMMARYDAIRQKHGGIGMSKISRANRCEQCGMALPIKTVEQAKDGRVVTCEACHRILYFTEGLV